MRNYSIKLTNEILEQKKEGSLLFPIFFFSSGPISFICTQLSALKEPDIVPTFVFTCAPCKKGPWVAHFSVSPMKNVFIVEQINCHF